MLRNQNFNAHHAPMGAFMSFTCGNAGTGGGVGIEIGKPATQNLIIGVKDGAPREPGAYRVLPFVKTAAEISAAASFDVEKAAARAQASRIYSPYADGEFVRDYNWATDSWSMSDFRFTLFTPFGPIPEPGDHQAMRDALLPAIVARLEIDNRAGLQEKTAFFGIDFGEGGVRVIDQPSNDLAGFALKRSIGVLAQLEGDGELQSLQGWGVSEALGSVNPTHSQGKTGGVYVRVPAGERRSVLLAIGCYLGGVVTTGFEGQYLYTRYYTCLEDVLETALQRASKLIDRSRVLDVELATSGLSEDQQFLIAHSTRSYYGNTQMLQVGGEPLWIVNEGEYCMMNTLDLTVDQVFWELAYNPWVVKNELDLFSRHYRYHDDVRDQAGALHAGGVTFAHDVGVHNNFSSPGRSSYELPKLTGCFSFMAFEELANWILTAVCYVVVSGDESWLKANLSLLEACASSLQARCDVNGLMRRDSSLCEGGAEITTYDSLDESLGQARSNTYIAVKTWACWVGLKLLDELHNTNIATEVNAAERIEALLGRELLPDGTLPAVLEKDNPGYQSRILPLAEGLVYPAYWRNMLRRRGLGGRAALMLDSATGGSLAKIIARHTAALLLDPERRNVFADGGIKLSSTSNNSWMSKIAILQYVCREVLEFETENQEISQLLDRSDAAHADWQMAGGFWACSDQFVSGVAKGSRYYPRLVTTALFLDRVSGRDSAKAPRQTVEA